eukprot:TRINITY_DN11006_c0_g1_i1.p1 TRINITY_DN11006_c0_g1~~TRINITY_DN11006_c0_g1_i1.p1  ORF type:complete len:283 (+),score=61.63 TRINITY_DN11006_c0_g1_i1:32-850(+)
MADPWGSGASTVIAGFDPNIASSLIDEINQIAVAFDSRYREIGTRLDGRDLRSKIEDLRRRANDATARLRQVLSQNCSPQLMSKKQELVQQGTVALEKLHAAEQNVQRRTSDVVTVMRASISQGKPPSQLEVGQLQLATDLQLKEINVDEQIARERNEDLQAINRDLAALMDVQKDFSKLTQEQGQMLTTAENQTTKAEQDIETGRQNIKESSSLMCSYRKKIFVIIIIVIIILAIIAIIIGVVVSRNNNNSNAGPAPVLPPTAATPSAAPV